MLQPSLTEMLSRSPSHAALPGTRSGTRAASRPEQARSLRALLPSAAACLLAAGGIFCAWQFTELGEFTSLARVASAARELRVSPLGPLYAVLAFVAGALLFVPSTLLIAGTVLAFGAERGFACALAGCVLSGAAGYGMGRLLAHRLVRSFAGPRFEHLRGALCTRAFHATLIARLLPVANFHAVNMFAGSLGVPFCKFLLGNVVGVLPYVVLLSLFARRLHRVLADPSLQSLGWLAASAAVLLGATLAMRRWTKKQEPNERA
jgi:uncharacterized membrane protein YdjX (TVP38/TMEM64 family)